MNPIILAGAGTLLFALGLGLGYWIAHLRRKGDAVRASDIQKEMEDYRRQVSEHFGETAQHFQELGKQYQSLYRHMAQGAGALCDVTESDALLGFAGGDAAKIAASETESPEVEPAAEASKTDVEAESPADEDIADQVVTPTPAEGQRTVH